MRRMRRRGSESEGQQYGTAYGPNAVVLIESGSQLGQNEGSKGWGWVEEE